MSFTIVAMNKSSVVESIKKKVGKLIDENIRLSKKCNEAVEIEAKLKDNNRVLQDNINELQKKIGVMELREGIASGSEDKRQAKARVNRLMREIDRCVAMMNN